MAGFAALLEAVNRLASTERRGWGIRDIGDPESVMDHSFRTAFLALVLADELDGMDRGRLVSMALIHDLAEAETGDITPFDGVGAREKEEMERKALHDLFAGGPHEAVLGLWEELEEGRTPEARAVHELDKLDMAFMALHYEKEGHDTGSLDEFWEDAKSKVSHPVLNELLAEMERERGR